MWDAYKQLQFFHLCMENSKDLPEEGCIKIMIMIADAINECDVSLWWVMKMTRQGEDIRFTVVSKYLFHLKIEMWWCFRS